MDEAALYSLMRPRKICICMQVGEDEIRRAVAGGARTFEEVQAITDCSTGCGTCEMAVRRVIATAVPAEELRGPPQSPPRRGVAVPPDPEHSAPFVEK